MEIPDSRLNLLLRYCRIDAPDETERQMICGMYAAAVAYMTRAGVPRPEHNPERAAQYDLLVNAMVLDAYDRRGMVSPAELLENPAIRKSLNQMKQSEPVSNPDTGGEGGGSGGTEP